MTSSGPLELVILGDSIAFGQGATSPEHAIGPRLAAALDAEGLPTRVTSHAVPGARSAGLAAQVRSAGTTRADVALIVIGANDITHFVPPAQAAAQLADAVRALHASGSRVVVAPAPDLSSIPWVPPQFRFLAQAASSAVRDAQSGAATAAGARVVLVDQLHQSFSSDVDLFSADRFHPSSRGYELIAAALLPAVRAAAGDALSARRGDSRA